MSRGLQKLGDANNGGGVITSVPQGNVYVNGVLAAVAGSTVTPHGNSRSKHTGVKTSGNSRIYINGIPASLSGDRDSCGHIRVGGSGNVFGGG